MNRRSFSAVLLPAAALAAAAVIAAPAAHAQSAVINLGPIAPANPGWGEYAQFRMLVSTSRGPVRNATVMCWFSGRHGITSAPWYVRTNNSGWAISTQQIPYSWKFYDTWVDINAACDQVGARNMWRVRNKK
jgi:hypothetical protein